jgi:NADPH2 dehydrogenase
MAPMTRYRADPNAVPPPFAADYYAQRSCVPGTLIVTEGTYISFKAGGDAYVPGIWSQDQITAWKAVTEKVHAQKGIIFAQLWALGRVIRTPGWEHTKAPSAIPDPSEGYHIPKPLTEEEIHEFIGWYVQAAKNAIAAGFDGVEIHGANGYLIDQFLHEASNTRTDGWGGSIEKRSRFGLEVTKAVVEAVGAERTAIRLSPFTTYISDEIWEGAQEQFSFFVRELKRFKLAYLHFNHEELSKEQLRCLVDIWDNTCPILIAGMFNTSSAYAAVDDWFKDHDVVVSFGFVLCFPSVP